MTENDLPLSFVLALSQNEPAMRRFKALPDCQKQDIILKAHSVRSKPEMRSFVDQMANGTGI